MAPGTFAPRLPALIGLLTLGAFWGVSLWKNSEPDLIRTSVTRASVCRGLESRLSRRPDGGCGGRGEIGVEGFSQRKDETPCSPTRAPSLHPPRRCGWAS